MKSFMALVLYLVVLAASTASAVPSAASEPGGDEWFKKHLESDGLVLSIHGFIQGSRYPIVTWRSNENFFKYCNLSLIPANDEVIERLQPLQRHDKIRVWGTLKTSSTGQRHLKINSMIVEEFFGERFPQERVIIDPTEVIFANVHFSDNKTLVLDWKGRVFPVVLSEPKTFWRNDIVRVSLEKKIWPSFPTHFKVVSPIEMIDSAKNLQSEPGTIEGRLVRYPQSPQIKFDVYAVEWNLNYGQCKRLLTILPEDMDDFFDIRQKLADFWLEYQGTVRRERNHEVSSCKIQVRGVFQVVTPGQANVQILIKSSEDIQEV